MKKIKKQLKVKRNRKKIKKTKDPRAAEVIEHLNRILSTSKSRDSLLDYAKHIYPGYKDPAHIKLIAKNLEALEKNEINRLAVFMPPRHGKSMLCSEFFPAWYLGNNPNEFVNKPINAVRKLYSGPSKGKSWIVGDKLIHSKFGKGEIIHIFGSGEKISLAVKFGDKGSKILDPRLAPIRYVS